MPTALVMGHYEYKAFMVANGYNTSLDTSELEGVDVVLFTGGIDINPEVYKEKRSLYVNNIDRVRDANETVVYKRAIEKGIPVAGICRGAQFLCAMNGGTLVQHMNGHHGKHFATLANGKNIQVSSDHHQMMRPRGDFTLLAHSTEPLSSVYYTEKGDIGEQGLTEFNGEMVEPEAVYFAKTKSLCVQWHPEWMNREAAGYKLFVNWMNNLLEEKK